MFSRFANRQPHSKERWTHWGALIEKSLALSRPSITCILNPSVPSSSLTSNLIGCFYFPWRQLPLLDHSTSYLSSSSNACAHWIYNSNLPEEPCTIQCNLWFILSLRLLSLVSTVIVWRIEKLRLFEACSPLPAVDRVSIIPGVSPYVGEVISRRERKTCKSNCFNPLKHLSSFSRGQQGVQRRSYVPWSWLEKENKSMMRLLGQLCSSYMWRSDGTFSLSLYVLSFNKQKQL